MATERKHMCRVRLKGHHAAYRSSRSVDWTLPVLKNARHEAFCHSVVAFRPESMEGGAGFSGASYQCTATSIEKTVVLPGGDRPYNPEDGCTINGVDRRWAALGNQIDGVLAQNVQLRNEIDGVQHDQNVRRRRDRAFAVTFAALFGCRRLARLIVKGCPWQFFPLASSPEQVLLVRECLFWSIHVASSSS